MCRFRTPGMKTSFINKAVALSGLSKQNNVTLFKITRCSTGESESIYAFKTELAAVLIDTED